MLNQMYEIWNWKDIEQLLVFILKDEWVNGLEVVFHSRTLQSLIFCEEFEIQKSLFKHHVLEILNEHQPKPKIFKR